VTTGARPVVGTLQYPSTGTDLNQIKNWLREFSYRHFPLISYKHLRIIESPVIDTVHDEAEEGKKLFDTAIGVRAFVKFNPETPLLKKYGIDEQRDVFLHIATPHLIDVGLAVESSDLYPLDNIPPTIKLIAGIGDRFTFDETTYEILSVQRTVYWANSNFPMWVICTGNRYRLYSKDGIIE